MSIADTPKIQELFLKLHKAIDEEEEPAACIKLCDQVLKTLPNDEDALKAKAVALLNDRQWAPALAIIERSPALKESMTFERLYTMYREQRHGQALALLEKVTTKTEAMYHLEAQCCFREKDFARCVDVYNTHLSSDEVDEEQKANVLAAMVGSGDTDEAVRKATEWGSDTFEAAYNAACVFIKIGNVEEAKRKLTFAKELCAKTLAAENADEQEARNEMAILCVQEAYLLQLMDPDAKEQALAVYTQTLMTPPPTDEAVVATASNNIITCRPTDEKLFDSLKRIERASKVPGAKLTAQQTRAIQKNKVLLLLYGKKIAKCQEALAVLKAADPDDEFPVLVEAALLHRGRLLAKCQEVLTTRIAAYPDASLQSRLTLVHILLLQKKSQLAVEQLEQLPEDVRHRPAVVAVVCALKEGLETSESAAETLRAGVAYWDANNKPALANRLLYKTGQLKAQTGQHREAAEQFKRLVENASSGDEKALYRSQLVMACSQFDTELAEQEAKLLPGLPGAELLDVQVLLQGAYDVRKEKRAKRDKPVDQPTMKKKARKRRKTRFPKNFDAANPGPPPDPQRWLPKWERTNVKKTRREKQLERQKGSGRGPQGGVLTDAQKVQEESEIGATPDAYHGGRGQKAPAGAKNKRRKGRRK